MTDPGSDRQIQSLIAWAVQNGASIHPSIQVHRTAATGLSLFVLPTAPTGPSPSEAILRVPTPLTLSYLDALSDGSFPAPLLAGAPPHLVGRLFLIRQFLLGTASFWWPYIQALPQPDDVDAWSLPPFWPPHEAELLDGTNVEVGAESIRCHVKRELSLARALLKDCRDYVAVSLAEALRTPTLYHWAYCIFSSRSFRPSLVLSARQDDLLAQHGASLDDFSLLFPLFDIANHDMTATVQWRRHEPSQACELLVDKFFPPGSQVFNNYSFKTNAELLLGYGFMLPVTDELHNDYAHVRKRDSPDEYLISLRPLAHPSSLLVRARQQRLEPDDDDVLGAFRHVQPDMVWDMFCALAPADSHQRLLPTPGRTGDDAERHRRRSFLTGSVTGECRLYLEQTVALIQHKVLQELERLDETDVEVAGGDANLLSRNQRLALDYRARCRQVLEKTLEAIRLDEPADDSE
ncbi:hypothetical protein XA68_10559 [Ophiocordyceps unilateralis]|uniref:SET domain-containing protein n=1 Tax=Ophiocordyceps unilateralis TaxID=268505 RepID=A0A2A9NZH7_OPHUN|nr:hypothetical protein XA68_10559 [Ophiocordyceps unilateralis]